MYSGIDQHKRTSHITTYDADGQLGKRAKLPNRPHPACAYFRDLPGPDKAVVESTGAW